MITRSTITEEVHHASVAAKTAQVTAAGSDGSPAAIIKECRAYREKQQATAISIALIALGLIALAIGLLT